MKTLGTAMLVMTLAFVAPPPTNATVLTGGNGKPDCYNGIDVTTPNPAGPKPSTIKKVSVKACNGSCTFTVKSCVGLTEPTKCTATALSSLVPTTLAPEGVPDNPATLGPENACGVEKTYTVTPTKKKAKVVLKLIGTATSAKPKKDKDNFKLECIKNDSNTDCGDVPPPCPDTCANPDGGPNQMVLTVGPSGSDLDNGWTGSSHNFIVVPNGKLGMCVTGGCNDADQTTCELCGKIGPGTISGTNFGAPLPLFASNVPVCVISRWRGEIHGTADQVTGATSLNVKLFSDVFLTTPDDVCPQCKNGKCNAAAGNNAGKDCTVEASVPVYRSATRTDNYDLSATCVYSSPPTATLNIDFVPLTSGTAPALVGPTPCTKKPGEPGGVPPQPDQCGASGCGSECTGTACVSKIPDPTNPAQMVCLDSKGGISQLCCNNKTNQPCHPLRDGGSVTRTGAIQPPQPPLPDTTYPKTQDGILVSTFCIPATGTNTIDSVTGLPGPGMIQLPGQAVWTK